MARISKKTAAEVRLLRQMEEAMADINLMPAEARKRLEAEYWALKRRYPHAG